MNQNYNTPILIVDLSGVESGSETDAFIAQFKTAYPSLKEAKLFFIYGGRIIGKIVGENLIYRSDLFALVRSEESNAAGEIFGVFYPRGEASEPQRFSITYAYEGGSGSGSEHEPA